MALAGRLHAGRLWLQTLTDASLHLLYGSTGTILVSASGNAPCAGVGRPALRGDRFGADGGPFIPDPADRIIVAAALSPGAIVATADRRMHDYARVRSTW